MAISGIAKDQAPYQLLPDLTAGEYQDLTEDIAKRGVMIPIEYDDQGNILDGHQRLKICAELGITTFPKVVRAGMSDADKRLHVRRLNLARRHMTQEQRRSQIQKHLRETPEKSDRQIAAKLGVSNSTVSIARKNLAKTNQVCESHTSIGADGKVYPRQVRHKPVSLFNPSPKEIAAIRNPAVMDKIMSGEANNVIDAQRKVIKETIISRYLTEQKPNGRVVDIFKTKTKYRVIYADPPWAYTLEQIGKGTSVSDHYPTMPLDDICALPVKNIVDKNAVLFLWVTSPMLEKGFKVINAWGFSYKASFVWDKIKHNMGHYNSVRHEFLLIGTQGSCVPDQAKLFDSVQSLERTEHSRKPEVFRDIIDTLYLHGNRLELFSRQSAAKWDSGGTKRHDLYRSLFGYLNSGFKFRLFVLLVSRFFRFGFLIVLPEVLHYLPHLGGNGIHQVPHPVCCRYGYPYSFQGLFQIFVLGIDISNGSISLHILRAVVNFPFQIGKFIIPLVEEV
jgi:N6-adenosine-specific RNA methylase IME4